MQVKTKAPNKAGRNKNAPKTHEKAKGRKKKAQKCTLKSVYGVSNLYVLVKNDGNIGKKSGKKNARYYVKFRTDGKDHTKAIDTISPTDTAKVMRQKVADFIDSQQAKLTGEEVLKPRTRQQFPEYVQEYLETKQYAPRGAQRFKTIIKDFSLNEIANEAAADKILNSPLNPATIALKINAINAFYRWLRDTHDIKTRPPFKTKPKANDRPRQRIATDEEITATLTEIKRRNDSDLLLFTLLLLNYGVRVSTAFACTPRTLQSDGYHFYNQKCRREYKYIIPAVSPETDELFMQHAQTGKMWKDGTTLPALTKRLAKILWKFGKDDNGENLSPHSFRHTAATRALRNGVPPEIVAQLLDHTSPVITLKVYARYSNNQIRDAAKLAAYNEGK